MIIRCSKCGYIPKTEAKFCEICGKQFTDEDRIPFLMTGKTVEIPFPLKDERVLRAHSPAFYQEIKTVTTTGYRKDTIAERALFRPPGALLGYGTKIHPVTMQQPIFRIVCGSLYLTNKSLVFWEEVAWGGLGADSLISIQKGISFSIPIDRISQISVGKMSTGLFHVGSKFGSIRIFYEFQNAMESVIVSLEYLPQTLRILQGIHIGSPEKRELKRRIKEFYINKVLPGWKTAIEEATEQAKKATSKPKEQLGTEEKLELLEERLLKGEISEETYKELKKKYEQG